LSLEELGKPFSILAQNDISDVRLDAKTWMIDTADNIFNFPKIPGQFFLPRDSGHGYTKNSPMYLSVDGDIMIALGLKKHTHSMDTDLEGGLMIEEFLANMGNLDVFLGTSWKATDFLQEVSGTGAAVADEVSGSSADTKLTAGTSTNGYANIKRFGVAMDFSKKSGFIARYELTGTIANYLLRLGIDAERLDLANDATQQSYGIEACSGQTNWQTWSCDGTTRSNTATSYAVDTNANVWMAQHDPTEPEIIFTKSLDLGANQVTKTSDIPVSGISASQSLWAAGIKSTTTSQSKDLKHRGVIVLANIGLTGWKWYAT
jgi:hypothetical protein